ncbi:MAG: hypothetical protein ACI4W1_03480 [Ruminococcus sp.]
MKKLKKPLAVLLVVITLLSTFSITAFAAEYEIAKFRLTKGEELNLKNKIPRYATCVPRHWVGWAGEIRTHG